MGAALHTTTADEADASPRAAWALRDLLDGLMHLLMTMPRAAYTAKIASCSGTIGAHVRHTLDHVAALVATNSRFDYDRRSRGTPVETDQSVAVREILRLQAALERWSRTGLTEMMPVTAMVAPGQSVTGWSSRARELAFVVSHTIHHQAIISVLLEMQGIGIASRDFGYSPSTPRT